MPTAFLTATSTLIGRYRDTTAALKRASTRVAEARAAVQEQEAQIAAFLEIYNVGANRRHFQILQEKVRVLGDLRTHLHLAANTEYAATRAAGEARFAMVDALPDAVREVL